MQEGPEYRKILATQIAISAPRAPLQCFAPSASGARGALGEPYGVTLPPRADTQSSQRAGLGWARTPKYLIYIIYSRWCEPSPAQKNLLQTRRKLCFCMRWALNPCPLRSCIRIETARRVSLDSSDMSGWARLMGRSGTSVEDAHFHALHVAASD